MTTGEALRVCGALPVPARVMARLESGASEISYTLLGRAPGPPGHAWHITAPSGRVLGLAFDDPDGQRLLILTQPHEPWRAIDDAFMRARIVRAWALRQALGLGEAEATHRLVNGAGDDLPGVVVDRYGAWAVVFAYARPLVPLALHAAAVVIEVCGLRGAVVKVRTRGAAAQGDVVQHIVGDEPPERLVVADGTRRVEVHLRTGMNTGLFPDLRVRRDGLAHWARGQDVLNLFAYTGALSVAAACGGARTVTSVDVSAGVLAWATDNARLNGLTTEPPTWRTRALDVREALDAESAEGQHYGLVLVDPPSFSSARGAAFALERDYPDVIARAARVLRPDGVLWLACNTSGVSLSGIAQAGLHAAGRRGLVLETAGLAPDFPTRVSDVAARYLQVLVLAVDGAAPTA